MRARTRPGHPHEQPLPQVAPPRPVVQPMPALLHHQLPSSRMVLQVVRGACARGWQCATHQHLLQPPVVGAACSTGVALPASSTATALSPVTVHSLAEQLPQPPQPAQPSACPTMCKPPACERMRAGLRCAIPQARHASLLLVQLLQG